MFLSKIWFVLVGLLAGIGLTAAFVAPRPADRRIEQLEGQRLDRAQYAAEQMLQKDAHRWIDYVAKLGRDAVLSESLDSATRGVGEAKVLHETVRGRLKFLVPDLAGTGVESVVAVDAKGRVVARVGEREGEFGDNIGGAEVVADALRGYLSDDVWGAGEKLSRIAAAPVLSKTRDRIVGVMFVAAETGKRLAEIWKKNLLVDVAVLLRKQVLSSTIPEGMLGELPELIEAHKAEISEAKRTRPMILSVGSDRLLAVAAPFTGQASEQEAYYVLIAKKAAASNPWALLSSTSSDDLKWTNFPWLPLAGGVVAMILIGLFLQRYEVESPLLRLRKELRRVADGDLHKIDDTTFHGKFGGIARDVNAAIERFTHSMPARSESSRSEISRKDFNAILDSGVPGGSGSFAPPTMALPNSPFAPPPAFPASPPPPAFPAPPPAPPPFAAAPPPFAPPPSPADPWKPAPPPRATAPVAAVEYANTLSGSPPPRPPAATPPRPPSPAPAPPPSFPRPTATYSTLPPAPSSGDSLFSAPVVEEDAPPRRPFSADLEDDATAQLPREEPTRTLDKVDPEEAHIREVFADYVSARRETGESTTSLTLEKFRTKLEANRQQLISKYACRTARFSVYIKDGKAAIKATPVRD